MIKDSKEYRRIYAKGYYAGKKAADCNLSEDISLEELQALNQNLLQKFISYFRAGLSL